MYHEKLIAYELYIFVKSKGTYYHANSMSDAAYFFGLSRMAFRSAIERNKNNIRKDIFFQRKPFKGVSKYKEIPHIIGSNARKQCGKTKVEVKQPVKGKTSTKQLFNLNTADHDDRGFLKPEKRLPNILLLDIETVPGIAYFWQKSVWNTNIPDNMIIKNWHILSWAAKWLFSDDMYSDICTPAELIQKKDITDEEMYEGHEDKRILQGLYKLLNEADVIIAHNALGFDVPNINTRLSINDFKPTGQYRIIDTLQQVRKKMAHTHNNLDALARAYGIGSKIKTDFDLWKKCKKGDTEALKQMQTYNMHDVSLLEEVYMKIRNYIKPPVNWALYCESDKYLCSTCGGDDLTEDGHYFTVVGRYKRFRCNCCGSYSRMRHSDLPVKFKTHLLTNNA